MTINTSHDLDLEQVILGALLLDDKCLVQVYDMLAPVKFYDIKNATIYEAIQSLYDKSEPIDIVTVGQCLRRMDKIKTAGGAAYVAQLTNRVASTANIESWVLSLSELYMRREFSLLGAKTMQECHDDMRDVFDIHDSFMEGMNAIFSKNVKSETLHVSEASKEATDYILRRNASASSVSGYTTGVRSVDNLIGGHQKSDLMYLAGRPAMGKTAMALSEVLELGLQNIPVAFFSLEMSKTQLVYRLMSMLTRIPAEVLMKQKLDPHDMTTYYLALDQLNRMPIFIDDTASLSVNDLRAKAKRLIHKHKVEIVYIDYVQLMSAGQAGKRNSMNREQEISTISRNLKLLAKECEIPVVCLAQLSRGVESRQDKRPLLSDLRESGSLEQDADVVAFLFRPEYYGITEDEEGHSTSGLGEYIVAKQRNGPTGIAQMKFDHPVMKYTNL
jgi:replicative DNA helicase